MTRFDQKKAELMNNGMIDRFQESGLRVPAAEDDPGRKETRSRIESDERKRCAEAKRLRKAQKAAAARNAVSS